MGGLLFCLFEGKINNNTNIHLDLRQIGCYCIRPTASYSNSQYCRRSRWIFAKYIYTIPLIFIEHMPIKKYGVVPHLSPLKPFPNIQKYVLSKDEQLHC